jgi:hypothetical protein
LIQNLVDSSPDIEYTQAFDVESSAWQSISSIASSIAVHI